MRKPILFTLSLACAWAQSAGYEQAVRLIQQGKHAEAVPLLEQASVVDPGNARVRSALGVAYAAQRMYDLAEPQFGRACALDSKLEDACYFHARALYALDRFEESIAVLKRLAAGHPASWQIELAMAQAEDGMGDAAGAERDFRQSKNLAQGAAAQPNDALGSFLLRHGRADEAVTLLQETLHRFPGDPEAQLHLGQALLEQNRFAQAIPYLESAVKAQPASQQAHLLLGKAYLRSGRTAEAQPHFAAAGR